MSDGNGFLRYDDRLKQFINITSSLTVWDASDKNLIESSKNFKKIRLCNRNDFEKVDNFKLFEENQENNFDHCIDDYDGMIITTNKN